MSDSLLVIPDITVVAPTGYEDEIAELAANNLRGQAVRISPVSWSNFGAQTDVSDILFANDLLDPKKVDPEGIISVLRERMGHRDASIVLHNTRYSALPLEIREKGRVIVIGSMTSLRIALTLLRK